MSSIYTRRALGLASTLFLVATAGAQTLGTDFANDYAMTDLGAVPGIPTPYGAVAFQQGDPHTLLIAGLANTPGGEICKIAVVRDANHRITGFLGPASLVSLAPHIDGGLDHGPGGVTFYTAYPSNVLGQIEAGSTVPDKLIDLTALGVDASVGASRFVPSGFPGANRYKIASRDVGTWYDAQVVPDGSGTFDLANVTRRANVAGGPTGIVYIHQQNLAFAAPSVLVAEHTAGTVGAYEVDAAGDPIPSTRRDFLTGAPDVEGAVIDPLTGDLLLSTSGSSGRVIVVSGFVAPRVYCDGKPNSLGCVPRMTFSGTPSLTGPDDFTVTISRLANNTRGLVFWSLGPDQVPFGGGTLCLAAPIHPCPAMSSGGGPGFANDCSGIGVQLLSQGWMNANGFMPGDSLFVQFLSRDPGFSAPENVGLSEALRFVIRP